MRALGLGAGTMMSYLAALGLFRALAKGGLNPRVRWVNGSPELTFDGESGSLLDDTEKIAEFLVHAYEPTPIMSPWNGGSGFGEKDKNQRKALDAVTKSGIRRLSDFPASRQAIQQVQATLGTKLTDKDFNKKLFVAELRNWLPDSALEWLDAAVVLTTEGVTFPVLLGTGGNDGRLEFSSNFHQRLINVLPELGATERTSLAWARDLLTGTSTTGRVPGAAGQFDSLAGGSANTSPSDDTESSVNPWEYVLMIEGATFFASSAVRRAGHTSSPGRAAMPFTVFGSPDGPLPGANNEESRGEVWTPLWDRAATYREIRALFRRAKAAWNGNTAVQATDMYAAIRSHGVDPLVTSFTRFQIVQRNGLSYAAVAADTVKVKQKAGIELLIPIQGRARAFGRAESGNAVAARRHFESAATRFAREVNAESLLALLAAQTAFELAIVRSGGSRESVLAVRGMASVDEVLPILADSLRAEPELRLAASIASGSFPARGTPGAGAPDTAAAPDTGATASAASLLPLRELLLGHSPTSRSDEWTLPPITGLGVQPLTSLLADVAVWRDQHADLSSTGAARGLRYLTRYGFLPHWTDAHRWLAGDLNDSRIELAFCAFLSVDWWRTRARRVSAETTGAYPIPALALLQALGSGQLARGASEGELLTQAIPRGWALRLRSNRQSEVLRDATALVNRLELPGAQRTVQAQADSHHDFVTPLPTSSGPRLLACLLAAPNLQAANLIDDRLPPAAPTRNPNHHEGARA